MRYAEWTLRWWMILCRILNDEQYTNYWMMNDRQYILNDEYYVRYWMILNDWMMNGVQSIEWWMLYGRNDECWQPYEVLNIEDYVKCEWYLMYWMIEWDKKDWTIVMTWLDER